MTKQSCLQDKQLLFEQKQLKVLALGQDLCDVNVNRMSIYRHREKNQSKSVSQLKQNFHVNGPITVHWDGKLMQALTGREHVDRLPVIVTGQGVRQLLGVAIMW